MSAYKDKRAQYLQSVSITYMVDQIMAQGGMRETVPLPQLCKPSTDNSASNIQSQFSRDNRWGNEMIRCLALKKLGSLGYRVMDSCSGQKEGTRV